MKQLIFSATKKDFRVDYFRSSGPGGQGVNKVNSGVRITHIPSGIAVRCTETRDQPENKKRAFRRLSKLVVQWAMSHENKPVHNISSETVRTYHGPDNRVKDHISGLKQTYKEVVVAGNIADMVESRTKAICQK